MKFEAELIWSPDHNSEDIDQEIENMLLRVYMMNSWIEGKIDTGFFLDFMDEQNTDVECLVEGWENQEILII